MRKNPSVIRQGRLADWLNPDGQKKVHSLVDKVIAVAAVSTGKSLEAFEQGLHENLQRLHEELRTGCCQPQPVRGVNISETGKPGEWRPHGIPGVIDRVCQQALLQRLEPLPKR